jgi:hypothetical protein
MTRAIVLTLTLAACTPTQLDGWSALLDVDVDPHDPHALALATDAWCAHGPALVDLVGAEAVEVMDPAPVACHPPGWVDLGHGVHGPPVLLAIRACESTDRYDAVSASGRYRGAYQFDQRTWDTVGPVGVDPAAADPAVQDAAAVALWEARGVQPWPICGRAS